MPDCIDAAAGWYPEWNPVTLDMIWLMGVQGWSNVDCVTVWLPATNWNCTISPWLALRLSGVYTRELLALDTVTT
jgi:hypothetical protein